MIKSLCIKVDKKNGEIIRKKLSDIGVLNRKLKIKSDKNHILIPVIRDLEEYETQIDEFKEIVKQPKISGKYEQIGNIAIIDRHETDAENIADLLIKQKKVKTVLQVLTPVIGEYRVRKYKFLAGERTTETMYKENGCRYLLDISKTYFTPRLATERMRIAKQIKNKDFVVDMFAGVGPFSILIAKNVLYSFVLAIDKNPDAIKYLRENIRLNKVENIEVRYGDVRDCVKDIKKANHVIMNLPHNSYEFLDIAFDIIDKNGIIHFYSISHIDDFSDIKKIENIAKKMNKEIQILNKRIVRPYAPYQYNICIEFKVK